MSSIVFTSNSKELLYTWGGDGKAKGGAVLDIVSGRERVRFAKHDSNVFCGASRPTVLLRLPREVRSTRSISGKPPMLRRSNAL